MTNERVRQQHRGGPLDLPMGRAVHRKACSLPPMPLVAPPVSVLRDGAQ